MTEKLKPCPFCGAEVETATRNFVDAYGSFTLLFIKCKNPDCRATISFDNAECNQEYAKATEYFNRRSNND